MTRKEALERLMAKVEEGGSFSWVEADVFDGPNLPLYVQNAFYSKSLDAAKALHEAVLPGYDYRIEYRTGVPRAIAFTGGTNSLSWSERITNDDPARAWLIAILKALIAQEQE